MSDKPRDARKASSDDLYEQIDNWFAGLTKTNKQQGLELMFENQLLLSLGVKDANGVLNASSTALQIAKAVMDGYFSVLAIHPELATLRVPEIERNPLINPRLSDFLPVQN